MKDIRKIKGDIILIDTGCINAVKSGAPLFITQKEGARHGKISSGIHVYDGAVIPRKKKKS
jgi:hypothetical protein